MLCEDFLRKSSQSRAIESETWKLVAEAQLAKAAAMTAQDVLDREADRKRKADIQEFEIEERRGRLKLAEEELNLRKDTNEFMRGLMTFMVEHSRK